LSEESLHHAVRTLLHQHAEHWGRDPQDLVQVSALAHAAIEVLLACGLAQPGVAGGVRPSPLAARFRSPSLRIAGAPA
jgi:hypothetical protein